MPSFRDAFAILQVSDVDRSVGFYRDLLGFRPTYSFPAEGVPQFVTVELGGTTLGLGASEEAVEPGGTAIWLYTEDVDASFAELREAGVRVLAEPADRPFGERVASIADPDGYTIHIGSPSG